MEYICPYCGNKEKHMHFCSVCHHDVEWIKPIIERSNAYYNKGYSAATQRDLSLAMHYLEKAIELNKYNIVARNLLGLILFEVGRVGEALKEWIISRSLDKEDTLSQTYIDQVQKEPKKLVNYKEATHLYNKALEYLNQNNMDVAIIRLKKAVSVNPHLVEAKVLLGLCYIKDKQFYKANEHIKATLLIDRGHQKALAYFHELSSKDTEAIQPYDIEYVSKAHPEKKIKPIRVIERGVTLRYSMMYLVIGILSMFVIYRYLILPSEVKGYERQITKLTEEQTQLAKQLDDMLKDERVRISELESTNKQLLSEKKTYEQQVSRYLQKEKLIEANEALVQSDYIGAANLLYNIAPSLLDENSKTQYQTLKEACYVKAARTLYDEGYQMYLQSQYVEAKTKFEAALVFEPTEDVVRKCIYYLGMSDLGLNNTTSAQSYFNRMTSEYPGTYEANLAQQELSKLEQ